MEKKEEKIELEKLINLCLGELYKNDFALRLCQV